jgi:hypothetical protein
MIDVKIEKKKHKLKMFLKNKKIELSFNSLAESKDYFEKYNSYNMYTSIGLILFGIFGNVISLLVLLFAKNKLPRINSINSLVMLTLTNVCLILVHFYSSTLSRIIYHFDLQNTILFKIHLYDSNVLICKLIAYFKLSSRLFNLALIIYFSFERTLATYIPIQSYKREKFFIKKCFFYVLCSISVILPIYNLFFYEIIQSSQSENLFNLAFFNSSKYFTLRSLTPIFKNEFCSIKCRHEGFYFKFHLVSNGYIILGNLFVSLSILAIVLRLKKKSNVMFRLNFNRSKEQAEEEDRLCSRFKKDSKSFKERESKINIPTRSSNRIKSFKNRCVNQRYHNTKMLLTLSLSFIVFNFPYFLVLFFVMTLNTNGFDMNNPDYFRNRLLLKRYFTITETFQMLNVTITGLLLFVSGKIFRKHFKLWLKTKIFKYLY